MAGVTTAALQASAERALALMRAQGFDGVQVGVSATAQDELNIAHNEPSLLRSTEQRRLSLLGLLDGRKASTELTSFDDEATLRAEVAALYETARSAPQDPANAVSSGQQAQLAHGPVEADVGLLAAKVAELLDFRACATPKMMLDEGMASHTRHRSQVLTSGGSVLGCDIGWYSLALFGTAREGTKSSSFNYTGGNVHTLDVPAPALFGIEEMLRDTERQIHTQGLGGRFVGDVVLTPPAVADLVEWLLGQLSDMALISGSSVYRDQVGAVVASPLLDLRSRFDAPGVAALTADGFVAAPVQLLQAGRLMTLTPSLYGSRKTGLPHVPVAGAGWDLAAGGTSRAELVAGVARGALVGRLSMGSPAPNGDFSGVIKNSFALEGGAVGPALAEVMIAGNVAQMLRDVVAVSAERIDTGDWRLPWLRVANLHFS